ncbi:hypothetical protein T11_1962, partial [Trichinella zimbabwensis]
QNASAGTPRRTCQSNVTSIAIRTPSSSYSKRPLGSLVLIGMVDCGTNFHGLILLVVELAISLDLQFVVLLVFLI